jgi:hypothetical protein
MFDKKKLPGKPALPLGERKVQLAVTVTPTQAATVRQFAARLQTSVSDLTRQALDLWLSEWGRHSHRQERRRSPGETGHQE